MGDAGAAAGDSFTFSAFISYARSDRAEAVRLQRRLEQYRLDTDLRVKEGERYLPARPLQPIFRDEDELIPGQDLPERIRKGLAASRFLIVLASATSAKSRWVEKEILDFMALGRPDRIIILVIDGEPNAVRAGKPADVECLPRPFRLKFAADGTATSEAVAEPNWVDWRGRRKHDRINFLRLVSALLQLDRFDDLLRRDARAERRRLRLFQAATGVFVALGVAAVLGGVLAAAQLNEVRTTESKFLADLAGDIGEPQGNALQGDHIRALQIALEGAPAATAPLYPRPFTIETDAALRRAIGHSRLRRYLGHDWPVRAVAISGDGTRVATLSESDNPLTEKARLTIWDAKSGKHVAPPLDLKHQAFNNIFDLVFSPDGRRMAVGLDNEVRLFDAKSGEQLGRVLQHTTNDTSKVSRAFSHDGRLFLTTTKEGLILWNAETGERVIEAKAPAAISPDFTRIVTWPDVKMMQLVDAMTGAKIGSAVPIAAGASEALFSGDSSTFALWSSDGVVVIWNARTGTPTGASIETRGKLIAMDRTGQRLVAATASAGPRGTAQLWNTRSGSAVGDPAPYDGNDLAALFSPDGSILFLSAGTEARLFDTQTGAARGATIRQPAGFGGAVFSGDSTRLAAADDTQDNTPGRVLLVDTRGAEQIGEPLQHSGAVVRMAFSSDSKRLLLSSADQTASLWNNNGTLVATLKHDALTSPSAFGAGFVTAWSTDGATIVTASYDGSARMWDGRLQTLNAAVMSHADEVDALALSPDGNVVATGAKDKTARFWHVTSGAPLGLVLRHQAEVEQVAFSPDGKRVLTLADDARLWDVRSGAQIGAPLKHTQRAAQIAFSPDGARIATASDDNTVLLWDARTGASVGAPIKLTNVVIKMLFDPQSARFVTLSGPEDARSSEGSGEARVWSAKDATAIGRAITHGQPLLEAAFSPDGTILATGARDGVVRLWTAQTGAPLGKPILHRDAVTGLAFSPGAARMLVSTYGELDFAGGMHLWDTTSHALVVALPDAALHKAMFSPDGRRIAAIGWGNQAFLFDGVTGQRVATMTHSHPGAGEALWNAAFSADGTVLATSGNGLVRVWDGRTGASLAPPVDGHIAAQAQALSPDGTLLFTTNGNEAARWNIAQVKAGPNVITRGCDVLASVGVGALPPSLGERAYRSTDATPACRQHGLLDWRFYAAGAGRF